MPNHNKLSDETKCLATVLFTDELHLLRNTLKNAHFHSQINPFASNEREHSLAIQNNVPQCTPLISKSLPAYLLQNSNTLFFNKIVHKQKSPWNRTKAH